MSKKIQRKPIRYLPERKIKDQAVANSFSIWDIITILGGATGVFVAILWLAGRFYMAGYLSAMNIPSNQINYSVWEYAEASWLRLIVYFLNKIYAPLLLLATVFLAILLLTPLLQRIFPKLKIIDAVKNIVSRTRNIRSGIRFGLILSIGTYLFYLLLLVFVDINESGRSVGRDAVLTKSHAVEVYSKDSLPLSVMRVVPNTTSSALIQYDGLRLLTYNNGKYYLFRDVDPITCRPSQVFIIDDSPDKYFVLGDISPIDAPCNISSTASPTP